jgi:rRNA biogenesis protein RRP5
MKDFQHPYFPRIFYRDEEEDEPFAHGTFVQCRVLAGVPSKPLVEVSLRCSRIEGDLDEDEPPEKGAIVHAYVVDTRKEGCFLRLSRQVEGRAILKELCDGFIPDPAAAFPPGRLIAGLVKDIRRVDKKDGHKIMVADIDMRESTLIDEAEDRVKFEDVKIGDKCKGTVTRIEEYGVFVRLVNSNVSGLVHKSECSDKYIKSLTDLYAPGDLVKLLVVKIDPLKKLVGFSMKASHFLNDPDSDDSSSSDEEDAMSVEDVDDNEDEKDGVDEENLELKGIVDDLDSEDENFAAKLASKIHETDDIDSDDSVAGSGDEESDSENDSGSDSSSEGEDENPNTGAEIKLDTNVGFNWNALTADDAERSVASDDSDASDTDGKDDEEDGLPGTSHKSRKKQAQRRREEQEITRREMALADGTVDANPETAADFERLIAGDPNSSELWIRYMAFHLTLADVEAAREVANRAFDRIEFREEKEKLNVWCALLTLELQYGNDESLQSTLERACQHNNPKQVYLRYCEMLEKQATSSSSSSSPESIKKTDETYTKMCKKFKDKKKVWIAHLEYLLKNGRHEEAFALSKRALLSLKPYKHVETMSKFAQLVFQYASAEKARTIFEGLLSKHPKRLDLLFVYADHEMKHGDGVDAARSLFVRVTNPRDATLPMKLSDKQMKRVFKKWFALEESHGTEETQERVKDAARAFVEYTAS